MDFRWLCCLNPLELSVTTWTAFELSLSLFVGVPVELWDALWLGGEPSVVARRVAYLSLMDLEIVTIVVGDPPVEVTVVRPIYIVEWVSISLHIDTTIPLCPDGCEYRSFP